MLPFEAPISGRTVPTETSSTSTSAMSNDAKASAKFFVLVLIVNSFGVMTQLVRCKMILCVSLLARQFSRPLLDTPHYLDYVGHRAVTLFTPSRVRPRSGRHRNGFGRPAS